MSVHYKFKSALNSDTVTFDGLHISVGDLKKAIIHQKRLGKTVDFDLQITNAQTKEEYLDNNTLIPKNTSLIVARIPLAVQPKKQWDIQAEKQQQQQQSHRHNNAPEPDGGALDLSQMNGTEEDKIQAMMIQSTMDYDPNNYQVIRGQSQVGEVPANYRCFKCRKPGHWIKNCPMNSNGEVNDFKRNTGIPRSFIERDAQDKNSPASADPVPSPAMEKKQEIPEDLICGICKDLFTDAVMIPCCGSSFCDECVRTALLESEDNECPDCKEKGSSPGSLIPNRFLRNSVNAFKNETGYSKPRPPKAQPKPKEVQEPPAPTPEVVVEQKNEPETPVEEKAESKPKPKLAEKEVEEPTISASSAAPEPQVKEQKEAENHDKKVEPGHQSSHDEIESDFEDNITVTVPAAHLISHQRHDHRERPYNGRHSRHLRPPGMEGSPKHSARPTPAHGDRGLSPISDEKESGHLDHHEHHDHLKHHQIPSHQQSSHRGEQIRPHRSTPTEIYGQGAPITSYPPAQGPMMVPGRPFEMGGYGPPPGPGYPPFMMEQRMRGPFHPIRPGYPQPHQMRPRMMAPPGSLASVYHGVAAKVGPGIIDDPLEAFNRIMREKEKRKEERRRGPTDNRRRSRSIEMNPVRGGRGHSPPPHHVRMQRGRSPEDRRMRSPQMRERRGRSREKRSPEKEKRRHRSSSFSDRSRSRSRSGSWSNLRKRSKSPGMRRRSRTRSPSFTLNRYHQKENRRPDRREEFHPREGFRDRSPGTFMPRRGARSPRRGQTSPMQHDVGGGQFYGRPERHGHGGGPPPPDQYFNMPPGPAGPYNDNGPYGQGNSNNNRYIERMPPHREQYGRDRGGDYKMERFDDGPPGNDEPPPPGFETSPPSPRENRNPWSHNPFDDRNRDRGENFRHEMRKELGGRNRGHSPNDLRDKHSPERDREDRRQQHEVRERERDARSWSRASHQSMQNPGPRRRSRSKSAVRIDRMNEEYSLGREREHVSKERKHGSRDRQMHERDRERHRDRDREKVEHEKKRDREERDRRTDDREKREQEKKQHDKDVKRVAKEEKEREKEREKEKDREKKRDSSEDEKKDKKSKEKRKKKKEKEAEKKKNKKEKKERKEREKDRDKEKEKEKERESSKKDISRESKTDESVVSSGNGEAPPPQPHVHTETADRSNIPDAELFNPPPPMEKPVITKEESDSNMEEGEIIDNDDNEVDLNAKQQHESEMLDLYGDICHDEEIKFDYNTKDHPSDVSFESKAHSQTHDRKKSSPPEFKRFDSVLDIHANLDFEPDLEDMEATEQKKESLPYASVLPELSKWEREDEFNQNKDDPNQSRSPETSDDKAAKVTSEVLKRAENAIFARAINAIRPIEIKKISVERQKLYSNDPSKDMSPVSSLITHVKSPARELATVQITVPANSSSERSVEIKPEKQKSIKDRLGCKITEPSSRRHRSKSQSPIRKSLVEKVRVARSRSRDREGANRRDDRDARRTSEIKRTHEATANRGREQRAQPDANRGRDQRRDEDRRRETGQNRSGARNDRDRDRERDRNPEQDRPPREKDRGRVEPVRNRERGDGDWNRGKERSREIQNPRDDRKAGSKIDEVRSKDRNKSRERDKTRDSKREVSASRSSTQDRSNRDNNSKQDRDHRRKHGDDPGRVPVEKRTKPDHSKDRGKNDSKGSDEKHEKRKKPSADEPHSVSAANEQTDKSRTDAKSSEPNATSRKSKDKTKTPEATRRSGSAAKRSRSPSESSSSSSSSTSDSESDSDENSKKKKRSKHKKNRKKSRRSSSVESGASSGKHKHGKSKKKNKSSKKKKKSKK